MAWLGIVTAESVFGVVVPAEPEPSSAGGVVPVSVGGVVSPEPSSGTVVPSSLGTVGVVSVPPLLPVGFDDLRVVAACLAEDDDAPAAVCELEDCVDVDVAPEALLGWCPCGDTWCPRSRTLGATTGAAVVAAGGVEAAAG